MRDLNIGVDADDHGFERVFKNSEEAAKGLDRELGRVARQQKLAEYATERSAAAVRRYGREQDKAALAAKKAGDTAERAAVRADLAIRRAAEAADKLAHGEITQAAAARQAAQVERAIERSALAAAAAHRAAARAADAQADQERQLGRSGTAAAGLLVKGASLAASKWQDASLLIKAGILALPVAATAAGAGISLGLGAGFAGGAIAMAAQNEKVKSQFSGLGRYVIADVKSWSVPYQGLLIRTASRAADAFDEIGPHVKDAFAGLEPDVEHFAQAALRAFGGLGPYIDRGVAAFHPLMTILSARLPGMIDNVANQLTRMTESVDPRAWDELLGGVNGLISGAGNLVVALEKVDSAYLALEGHSTAGAAAQQGQIDVWQQIGQKLGLVNPQVSELVPLTRDATEGMRSFGDSAKIAADKAKEAADKLDAFHQAVLGSYNSELSFENAVDAANKGIEKQHNHLTRFEQVGKNNRRLLLDLAGAAVQFAGDVKKSGGDAEGAMAKGYRAFVHAAVGAGMTRSAAAALARQIGLVPSSKSTRFTTNSAAVKQAIRDLQSYINRLHGKSIANHVTTYYSNVGSVAFGPGNRKLGYAKGGLVGYASGGMVHSVPAYPAGGLLGGVGTGTSDSNLIAASKGEFVMNARDTARNLPALEAMNAGMLQISKAVQRPPSVARPLPRPAMAAGSAGVLRLEFVSGGSRFDDALLEVVQKAVRVRGGNVQLVIGKGKG